MVEQRPLFEAGSSLQIDQWGNEFDSGMSFVERHACLGHVWRNETGYVSLASGASTYLTFTTPATGCCLYSLSSLDKSGDEVQKSLVNSGVLTGGTVSTFFNLKGDIEDSDSPFTSVSSGGTLTGGTERFISMAPGTGIGNSNAGGDSESEGFIRLSKNTQYSLKLTAIGGAATITAHVNILYLEGLNE